MSRGRYLSLEEARKSGTLDRFVKEHPSESDRTRFDRLLVEMSKTTKGAEEASSREHDASSSEIQTRQDI